MFWLVNSTVIDKPHVDKGTVIEPVQKEKVDPPKPYAVLALDDNTTPHDFVIKTLCSHFNLTPERAQMVMKHAEKNGKAVVQIYPKDVAESKVETVNAFARATRNPTFNRPMELTFICEPT